MNDQELLRYSRQIMLPELDIAGQQKLSVAKALVIGLGGLGSPIALYLASAGIGEITLVDDDDVDLSNLQRQIIHNEARIGTNKAESAALTLHALNNDCKVNTITHRLTQSEINTLLADTTIVFDATDNLATRHMINEMCWRNKVPLISGAAIQWQGQITLFDPSDRDSPCYRCLYPDDPTANELNCAENGVIAPLVGIIGSCQALEGIKYLAGVKPSLAGYVLYLDSKYMEWRRLRLPVLKDCPVCADRV
ncbi:MAG: molybdopterin-synthase adenylyltransferase MoeB [Pseudomonadota bacterium]|nr:molybdopterin-synthase adenylyltransferase MoeB [Pseudomonadota bacterium]